MISKKEEIEIEVLSHESVLQNILNQFQKSKQIDLDITKKFIFIYGVAQIMNSLYKYKDSDEFPPINILIDENYEPKLSNFNSQILDQEDDFSSYQLYQKSIHSSNDYQINTEKIDILAFALLTFQILSNKPILNVNDINHSEIQNKLLQLNLSEKIIDLLYSCIDQNLSNRPSFQSICTILDQNIENIPDIDKDIFQQYKNTLIPMLLNFEISPEVQLMKKEADDGNVEMMFLYGKSRLDGTKCTKNKEEAIKYFQMAQKEGNEDAIRQLKILMYDDYDFDINIINLPQINEEMSNQDSLEHEEEEPQEVQQSLYLADDPYFDSHNNDFQTLIEGIDQQINNEEIFSFDSEKIKKIEKLNFICTPKAQENIMTLYKYIKVSVPALLEGQTGTSKTLTAEIVCKLLDIEMIRFNLSSETKIQDLFGRYSGDENSFSGISYQDGPFLIAFREGKVLLLDEINLASSSVLQCIEESLDSGYLSVEIPGKPLQNEIKMHPNFRLIATQNPNKGSYANKRQNLGQKFYSRFKIINFLPFTEEELLDIAKGLAERFGYKNMNVVNDLVSFHQKWIKESITFDDVQCFTIREIAATVNALSQKESIYDTIMTIYGARYEKRKRILLEKMLMNENNFPNLNKEIQLENRKENIYPNFKEICKGCFMNESLKFVIKSTLFSLKNGRNVIITGKKGCGKTQAALWISDYYNNIIKDNDSNSNNEKQSLFCFCSEEIKVADLVGHQAPSGRSDGTTDLIQWQDGFLTKAIKLGKCAVLESIDEAPSTVNERLNGLLDNKYDGEKKYFEIPENSMNPRVEIADSFRIIGTSDIDKLQQMSPAFLNRFDIIVLENQMDDINEEQFKMLLSTLMDKFCFNLSLESQREEKMNDIISENVQEVDEYLKPKEKDGSSYKYPEELIQLIYTKVKDEKNISFVSKICYSVINLCHSLQKKDPIKDITKENDVNDIDDVVDSVGVSFEDINICDSEIVEFTFNLLQNRNNFNVPMNIQTKLLNTFQEISDSTDDPFFYINSPRLCSFMAKLAAYSIISQPVCITGQTGVGKTSSARAFAQMRKRKYTSHSGFRMHSFHSGTKVSHFYGSTTLQDGKIIFHDGTVTEALKYGLVFIADEFNLSTPSVMKSLSLALDPTIGKDVFVPGIGEIINISPDFHFIVCQNDVGTIGRNAIPDSIITRFCEIDYPDPEENDIQNICISIAKQIFQKYKTEKEFGANEENLVRSIANYMIKLNNNELRRATSLFYVPSWSLRDITKLFRRIFAQDSDKFLNIDPIHHVLFYTMSAVPLKFEGKILLEVQTLMEKSFNDGKKDIDIQKYIECYRADPSIDLLENDTCYIMKGNVGVKFDNSQKLINQNLPTLWNAIFKVSLSDKKEPLLIVGNSGFKTFLSQLFLPKAQVITLNQETNIAQLLGSSGFMKSKEAKMFYIENICKIVQNQSQSIEFKKKLDSNDLEEDEVEEFISNGKLGITSTFFYALDHLGEKLFQNNNNQNCLLSDTILEFRPGLFLNAILQGQSLILKELSNLPTIVLERFNELFSGKQSITLSEDIHDTFSSPDMKELTNFNDSFRVIATCPENSSSKLSEAVLSRFTVITIKEYNQEEQKVVIKSYIKDKDLNFELTTNDSSSDDNDIDKLNQFALTDLSNIKLHFSFQQMIKVVEIASKLNQKTISQSHNRNIGIALYRVLGGMIESKKNRKILFGKIKNYFDIPEIYEMNESDICQIKIDEKDKMKGLKSELSNLFLTYPNVQESQSQVAYTESFNDLLDVLHMGLTIHNPIILEGPPGQGKHTAINYITEMLQIKVVPITLSQSTKLEDLFGKEKIVSKNDGIHVEMSNSPFVEIIKSAQNSNERSLIILENINNASQALLNALVPVFNSFSTSILLPNGSTIEKGTFDIIGICNTQQMSSSKEKLPPSLIHSSIYYVVPKPEKKEIWSIINTKFDLAGLSDEAIIFNNRFNKAKELLLKEGYSSELYTLNDIDKYILFRQLTKDIYDEDTISQMIFAYRFLSEEMIEKMRIKLDLGKMKFHPIFGYNTEMSNLFVKLLKDDNNDGKSVNNNDAINLPLIKPPKDTKYISLIESLTLPQKHCLIFLIFSLLTKRSCVIQGDTASGKSYLIYLLAKLVGAKLNVFQMNSDCNLSMLAGQSVLDNSLREVDKNKLKRYLRDLEVDEIMKNYLNDPTKIEIKKPETWSPKILKDLLRFITKRSDEIKNTKLYPEIEESLKNIKKILSPVNRFKHHDSAFTNALKYGEWVLIDGIESSPSIIAEKISFLCGENPKLNLFECNSDFNFSKENIHPNFHLFITYNPNAMKSQIIDQTFFVRSVTFTLPPFDDLVKNSAQMLLGSFTNLSYQPEYSKEMAARLANLHQYAKLESQKNPDNFSGGNVFDGRTLKFITKAFSAPNTEGQSKDKNLLEKISFSTKSFYINSLSDKNIVNDFSSNCLKKLKELPTDELMKSLQSSDYDPRPRNVEILLVLRNIQRCILNYPGSENYKLQFSGFINACSHIKIYDLNYIENHINMTTELIEYHKENNNYWIDYGSLLAISSLLEEIINPSLPIKNEHSSLSICDQELKNNESILIPILKFDLLQLIARENVFFIRCSVLLRNQEKIDILMKMNDMIGDDKNKSIFDFISCNEQNIELKENALQLFKYAKLSKNLKIADIKGPSLKSIFSLRNLYDVNDSPTISYIWNIIYTLPNDLIEMLTRVINPIESKLLSSAFEIYKSLNDDNFYLISDWCEWAQKIDENTKILKNIILKSAFNFQKDTDKMITDIENEITYLKEGSETVKVLWQPDNLISLYDSTLEQYKKVQAVNISKSNVLQIKEKINNLKKRLISTSISADFNKMRADLVDQLDSIKDFNNEVLSSAINIVDKFISDCESNEQQDSFIFLPPVDFKDNGPSPNSENIKLFEVLIWYSKIKLILADLFNGKSMISNLWKLNDFDEMINIRKVILDKLVKNSNNKIELDEEDKKLAMHTLNANMIIKLYQINKLFLSDPNKIYRVINSYINRNSSDANEIQWVYQNSSKYSADLLLKIPKFEPNDILFLAIKKKSISQYQAGPLFPGLKDKSFINEMEQLMNNQFNSYEQVFDLINKKGKSVLEKANKNSQSNSNDFNNDCINHGLVKLDKIVKCFLNSKSQNERLKFNDAKLLTPNWISDDKLLNTFPSLFYWLCKNTKSANQILMKNRNYSKNINTNEIPFWLLLLRIISSMDCVVFDSESHTTLSSIIYNAISENVRDYLKTSLKNKTSLNFNWLNLLISNLPAHLINPSIKSIHDFLVMLGMDDYRSQSRYVEELKESIIFDEVSKITKKLLSEKVQDLFTSEVSNNFLAFPSQFIKAKMNEKVYHIYKSILDNDSTTQLKNLLKESNKFDDLIKNLTKKINKEEEAAKKEFKKNFEKKKKELISQKCKDINDIIKKYNDNVYSLIVHNVVRLLTNYKKTLEIYTELFKNDGIALIRLRYLTDKIEKVVIKIDGENKKIKLPNSHNAKQYHYLFPDEKFNESDNPGLNIKEDGRSYFKYILRIPPMQVPPFFRHSTPKSIGGMEEV